MLLNFSMTFSPSSFIKPSRVSYRSQRGEVTRKDMSGPKEWNFIFLVSAGGVAALESFKIIFIFICFYFFR